MPVNPISRFAWRLTMVTLTVPAAAHAASTTAAVGATIISPAYVAVAAVTQVLFGASTGAFTLSIPGAAGAAGGGGSGAEAGTPAGGLALTSADGSPPSGEQLAALTVSDGTLNGGQGVSFSFAGDGGTQLVGTVAFD